MNVQDLKLAFVALSPAELQEWLRGKEASPVVHSYVSPGTDENAFKDEGEGDPVWISYDAGDGE